MQVVSKNLCIPPGIDQITLGIELHDWRSLGHDVVGTEESRNFSLRAPILSRRRNGLVRQVVYSQTQLLCLSGDRSGLCSLLRGLLRIVFNPLILSSAVAYSNEVGADLQLPQKM